MRATSLLLACLVVAVSGCGSASGGAFEPAGDEGGVGPSGAAGKAANESPAGADQVEVAPGLTLVYEDPLPSDPVHAQVMKGVRAYLEAKYRGIATGGKDTSYRDVTVDRGTPELREGIDDYAKRGVTVKGPVRVYQAKVVSVWKGKGAHVDFCVDERGAKMTKIKTGATVKPKGMIFLWKQTVGMRLVNGRWRAALFEYDPPANKECRR